VYLLDTNIVSLFDPRRREQFGPVISWMQRNDRALSLSTVTLIEIEAGLLKLRRVGQDNRAREIEALRDGLVTGFADRLLAMDAMVAFNVARLGEAARPSVVDIKDLIIAATAKTHGLTVLTRNLRHFAPTGVATLDPLAGLPSGSEA
jgi:predicted nucleic acid-binding protein